MSDHRTPIYMAIDPGVRKGHGVALFKGPVLFKAVMVKDMDAFLSELSQEYCVETLVIETPVVRPTVRQAGRQSDIVDLAVAAGRAIGEVCTYYPACQVKNLKPEEWKGQITKRIGVNRIINRLSKQELKAIPPRPPTDIYDAIGIGLHIFDKERALR